MDHYKVSCCEKVRLAEKKLSKEIAELKNEVIENEMVFGKGYRPISSISIPMNPDYFRRERKLTIKKALDVSGAQPLKNQGQVMVDELEATLKSDINKQSLPLLLHQFYLDRMQSLVQCNHLHMLRWRRFCEHTDAIERMYPKYKRRLDEIKREYENAKQRAQRLSVAHQSFMMGDNKALQSVNPDDIAVYFRWLVVHLHSTKKFCCYLKLLQWLPVIHKHNFDLQLATPAQQPTDIDAVNQMAADAKSAWKTMTAGLDFSFLSPSTTSLRSSGGRTTSMTVSSDLAFSGFVSNEVTLGLPCHMVELANFRDQLEALTAEYGIMIRSELATSADEMELFGAVNRHFKNLFNRQLDCLTFYQYDNSPEGFEHWGIDCATHCLKKPSNWLKHVRIKPRKEANYLRQMTHLNECGHVDELLRSQNAFLNVGDYARVTEALKDHAVAVREPPLVRAISVTSHPGGKLKTKSVWGRIYEDAEKSANDDSNANDFSKESREKSASRFGRQTKKKESYDYTNTMQMLGLDEGDDSASQDPTVIQGAYLSFLHLRHLKIRDLRRQCLGILNYFRSIERTITIYDGGLSHETNQDHAAKKEENKTTRKKNVKTTQFSQPSTSPKLNQSLGGKGQTLGIGSHQFVHNTPADYKIDQNRFMEYSGVENHDDFYSLDLEEDIDEEGSGLMGGDVTRGGEWRSSITAAAVSSGSTGADSIPHVQDHRGYFIMYDSAVSDLRKLDEELVLVASQFIEKDTAYRSVLRRSAAEKAMRRNEAPGEVDVASYAHRDVDRFAVLLDMWTCELNFLVNKRKLLDCYVEAYHTTFDAIERHNLSQVITDVVHQRPRYDFTQDYFIRTYRGECACLRLKTALLTNILTSNMEESKHYLNKIVRPVHVVGMPMHATTRQDIAINLPRPSLKHVDMLEFHPTLGALASRLMEALRIANHELLLIHRPGSMSERITLEKQLLEHAKQEWDGMAGVGSSYSQQLQKDIFAEDFSEDVFLLNDAVESVSDSEMLTSLDSNKDAVDKETKIDVWSKAVDLILLRHRLIEAAWETEILSRLYKKAGSEMGFDEFHMYLRLVQFEFANRKERVDPSPTMFSSFIADDISADRYIPNQLFLAVQEMDENHLPKFSFRNRESFQELLKKEGLCENFRVTVACQVAHKNALAVAVTQSENCRRFKELKPGSFPDISKQGSTRDVSDSRSNLSVATTVTQGTLRSGTTSPGVGAKRLPQTNLYNGNLKYGYDKQKRSPEPFISIQLEKLGPRDVVVNAFIHKKETQGMMMRKEGEVEKLKRALVIDFCKEVAFRMSLFAMRSQIIACYSSILTALEAFPSTRENFFMIGRANEKKRKQDDVSAMIPDPKSFQKRPRRVLSPDGKCFMNLWFIPHYTEVLSTYRNMDYEAQDNILTEWLGIATALHDIVLSLCARSRLGSASVLHKLGKVGYTVAADWGGAEGIGSQLSELQEQINSLDPGPSPHTHDPSKIAELLNFKKDILFMEFDAAIRHSIREAFLALSNISAYQSVTDNMHFGLSPLSNAWEPSITAIQMRLPEVLDPGSAEAVTIFPWLSFQAWHGSYPTSYPEYWNDPESCMQLCLAGLNDIDRQLANGELLGVSLLLQEVLNNGTIAYHSLEGTSEEMPKGFLSLYQVGKQGAGKTESTGMRDDASVSLKVSDLSVPSAARKELKKRREPKFSPTAPVDKLLYPIEAFRMMKTFLRLWKQLEVFKLNWGKTKLHIKNIDTPSLYKEMNHAFRSEVMAPVFTSMARQMGNLEMYDDIASDDLPLPPPPGAPEMAIRAKLLIKLLEVYECKMINETRQRISKEFTLTLAERSREETALPTDLWSHHQSGGGTAIRESFTVSRPHIVEDFLRRLLSDAKSENGNIAFSKEHLNSCFLALGTSVMKRERENYESYSMYYENLLRHHHHLLYMKELEIKALESKRSIYDGENGVGAQFQLADRSHELILEITALRAKVTEMREQLITLDQDNRDDVRKEYQDLVQNLFEACFQMKSRLAMCHLSIHDDVRSMITETREEAMKSLGKLKNQAPTSTAEERLRTIVIKEKQVQDLQDEQFGLNKLLTKMHALHHWKQTAMVERNKVTVEKLSQEVIRTRRDCLSKSLVSKEEAELLQEELMSARRSLQGSDNKLRKTFEQIERDKKLQKEKEYKELQEQRNRQQLAAARQRDMERLAVELHEKDKRLRTLTANVERNAKLEHSNQTKIQRNLKQMQTQLSIERTLKLDAFDRVDNLQAQVMETERDGIFTSSRPTSASPSLSKSAVTQRSRTQSALAMSPTPSTPNIRVRPLSCVPGYYGKHDVQMPKKRPQTAAGRLKNKIAAAILTEIYPPKAEHESVIQLSRMGD